MAELETPDGPIAIYATFPDFTTAEEAGDALVTAGLAACVNLIAGMRSTYRWKGAVERAEEVVAIVKTRATLADAVSQVIAAHHPYDTPAVVVLPIVGGDARYLAWIMSETATDIR